MASSRHIDPRHNPRAPGFAATRDPFAGFSQQGADDEAETFDFEDAYDDNVGNRLEEKDDAFNDDTFGGGPIGTDFDFSQGAMGQSTAPQQQPHFSQALPVRQLSPPRHAAKPARTGYESYKQPNRLPDLAPSASIWGPEPVRRDSTSTQQQSSHGNLPSMATATKKMMSLEEVEAMMRSQSKKPTSSTPGQEQSSARHAPPVVAPPAFHGSPLPDRPQIVQRPPPPSSQDQYGPSYENLAIRGQSGFMPHPSYPGPSQPRNPQVSPQPATSQARDHLNGQQPMQPNIPPRQILQNPQRAPQSGHDRNMSNSGTQQAPSAHHRGPSIGGRPVTHPDQITQLSESERAAFYLEEANRAKRNHKIHLLSKHNGLMTPQDKNFITRIQLQQLVTATGGTDDAGPDAILAEDFYYQVFIMIRGAPRQDNYFAQTYLNQLSWRGGGNRRQARGGDNHMRRMEQQVQRAVDAARARPKNKQLVVEGSLGKISFSNAKTPKPLLNIRRQENQEIRTPPNTGRARQQDTTASRKIVLRNIEAVYGSLMRMEDHERKMPPPPREESPADVIQEFMEWRQKTQQLNATLWNDLKVLEPIVPNSPTPHPFIAILSHGKGKKLIPRIFRQIDDQQRLMVLTIIVVQLDMLDVIRFAQPRGHSTPLSAPIRAEIVLYAQDVEPCLFAYIGEAPLPNVTGLVGILATRVNLATVITTRTGVNLLTRLITRAALVIDHADSQEVAQWTSSYDRLFALLEPQLQYIWQTPVTSGDAGDFGNWQFLAALGVAAGPDQQQRLVLAVKDRVIETVGYAKGLGEAEEKPKIDMVNLFMHAIGLDVDMLAEA